MFKWLMGASEDEESFHIAIEDLIKFYRDKITILNDEKISVNGFNCFRSLFCLINEKQNKLLKVEAK